MLRAVSLSPAYIQQNATPGVYNLKPSNLSKWRKALANVRAGVSRGRLALVGDSTTLGYGSDTVGSTNNCVAKSYPSYLASALSSYFVPARADGGWGMALNAAVDPRWTFGAGWANNTNSLGGAMAKCTSPATGIAAFTPANQWDTAIIFYAKNTGLGTFTVNTDGGATLATVNSAAGASGYASQTVTTTLGTHTLNIARNGTGGDIYIDGVICYDSTTKAVDVLNIGWSGSTVSGWGQVGSAWVPTLALPVVAPDLTIIDLTINDWKAGTSIATYKSVIQSLITAAKSSGDAILMTGVPSAATEASVAQQQVYIDANLDLALTNDIPMISLTDRWVSYASANALGYYGDTLHPVAFGYNDVAQAVARVVGRP